MEGLSPAVKKAHNTDIRAFWRSHPPGLTDRGRGSPKLTRLHLFPSLLALTVWRFGQQHRHHQGAGDRCKVSGIRISGVKAKDSVF